MVQRVYLRLNGGEGFHVHAAQLKRLTLISWRLDGTPEGDEGGVHRHRLVARLTTSTTL